MVEPLEKTAINSDEATQAQQDAIESDIKAQSPMISSLLPLSTLRDDFSGHGVYLEKLKFLDQKYSSLRRLRRDGSCFYRAFGFAYVEYLSKNRHLKETVRFRKKCDDCRDTLIALGYTQFTVEDFHEQFTGMIDQFTVGDGGSLSELEEIFNNQAYSDYYVVFLRLLVSAFIQKHADFYTGFIDEGRNIKEFCETEVEPMTRESDNIHVAALALAVGIPIGVENCQQSGDLTRIDFPAESSDVVVSADDNREQVFQQPPVILLYRPGHYDILYASS